MDPGRVGLRLDVQHRVLGRVPRLDREEPRINRGFSLDAELAKIREVIVVNPFPPDEVERYHEFMKNKMR